MKRKIAAILISSLLTGPALAGPIESSELPPPAPNAATSLDDAQLRGLIEDALDRGKDRKSSRAHKPAPSAQSATKSDGQNYAHEDWNAYSSAELWLEGIPESEGISLEAIARRNRLTPASVERAGNALPTSYKWNRGNWKADFGTNVTTAQPSPIVIPSEHYAGAITPLGGAGEFKGRVEYDVNAWQFYGATRRSIVANPDGTLSLANTFTGGTYYNLPTTLLGGKLGTGFEFNPVGDAKTRLEYRQTFGNTEGFLAAERIAPFHTTPDATGSNALKAGINRKF